MQFKKLHKFVIFLAISIISIFSVPAAHAALPTFVACDGASGSTGAITPTLPTGIAANDILLMFIETDAQAISVANGNGGTWAEVLNSPQDEGANTRLTVFWSRYNGTQTAPTTSDSGDHQVGVICAYDNVVTSGNPWDVTSGAVGSTNDQTGSIPAATTTGPDRLVVIVGAADDDNDTPVTTVTNSSLASISSSRVNAETSQGNDGGLTVFDGQKATAGSYGITDLRYTSATRKAMMAISLKPRPTTTIGDGADPSNSSIAPGASATDLDAFTLQTSEGTDTVTAATVTLSASVSGGLSLVAITNNAGSVTYCSQSNPASSTVSLTSCGIPVTTTLTSFKIRITPKSHANMPAPPGSTYSVTGTITAFTSTNTQSGTDTNSATVTIDNSSPANVTSASGSAGDSQVSLSWTNPADSDFHSSVVLRRAGTAVSDTPSEGATYIVGNTVGSSTVACVVSSPTASCTDTGLTNGTAYHYRIYTRDTNVNYSATGVVPTGSPFTPRNPVPTTTSISPTSKNVGDSQFTMTVNGTNFVSSSVVKFDGSNRTTTFVSSTQLTATIPASDLTTAGTFSITVFNPTPGGGTSNAQTFTVNNLTPTTTSISPTSKIVGDSQFTMTVNGTNFVSSSVVKFDGSNRTTTFVSSTQLTATIPASDLTTAGTFSITVFNPTPGGGTSNAQTFTVNNPVPTTTSISPTSKIVGASTFTLTVNGTNFISSSVVRFDGSNRTTTYISATELTATIPASDLTTAGTFSITVFNPTPGGGTSNAQTFTVNNPVPTTTSISPTSKTAGDSGFTMTVNGTNFISSSVVKFDGSARSTTFVNSTQLTASILTSDLTTAGTFDITVFNPTPGGGTSNAQTFTVNAADNPVPTTTSISPDSKTVGDSQFTMTVNGTNFISSSVVKFDGSNRTTSFVSSTQLTATIPASDLTAAGTFAITVFNPTPGGGTSNAQTFTVGNPVPTTTSISPTSKTVGDSQFTMTVNGTNFISSSVVKFDGSNRTTTYVSATQLTATIPGSDLTAAGTFAITVFNPTPGGGTSNAQTFTVNNPVPTTTSISPTSKTAGDSTFTLTVNGTNFVSTSTVNFEGSARTTAFVSSVQLTASIPASDLTTAGTFSITVTNPTPGGGTSNAQTLTVNNPVPTTTSISPTSKNVGDSQFTMTVNGTNFVSSSVVKFDGSNRTTSFVSSTELTATIPASDLTTAGTFSITVFNPTPGGGTSNAQTFTVGNLVPTTTSISPSSKTAGDAEFAMTVNGTNFVSGSVVKFDGSNRTTSFVSSTELTATIPASDLTTAGTFNITVENPAPSGGTSNAQIFTVNNLVPTTTSISPTSKNQGDSQFTMTVNGTNFVSASIVKFEGSSRTTSFVSSTELTAIIPASDLTTAGSFSITVTNPTPGGGTSNAQTFTVVGLNPTPTTSSISPTSKTVGDAEFTMTVSGTDFVSSSVVKFDGSNRATTFVSSTQLTATIPASDLTAEGTFNITVFNPTPGGGTSNAQTFTVSAGVTPPPPPPPPPPTPTPTPTPPPPPPPGVFFSGRAYPNSIIKIVAQRNGVVTTMNQVSAEPSGDFRIGLETPENLNLYAIVIVDKDGRSAQTRFYNTEGLRIFTSSDVFYPPTIGLQRTIVTKGDILTVVGYGTLASYIEFQVDDKLISDKPQIQPEGSYRMQISTADLDFGTHTVKSRQVDDRGRLSEFSIQKVFVVSRLIAPKTDLNGDGIINITDFSIFSVKWDTRETNPDPQIDFNSDGQIDISDFSIFMRILTR